MNSRILSGFLIVFSSVTLLWLAPRWLAASEAVPRELSRPVDPGRPPARAKADKRFADAVVVLARIPHPPILAGGRVNAAVVNGVGLATCAFQTRGACVDVMDFYLERLTARNWRDVTDEHLQRPDGNTFTANSLQTAEDAERYDSIRSTEAILVKNSRTLTITLKPAALGRCDVSITSACTPDLAGLWKSTFASSENLAHKPGANAWLATSSPRPGGATAARLYTGRGSPDDLIASLAADMHRQGWTPVLAPRDNRPGVKACMFTKPGGGWAMATAKRETRGNASRAVLYIQ